ncbi:MAG: type II secretion system minor pseudopilin GspK [Acidiferrobacterales bacterium]
MVKGNKLSSNFRGVSHQNGLALVTVMLVVVLAASIAAFMGLRQQSWIRHAENIKDRTQAAHIFESALAVATIVLERDAAKNNSDHRGEAWNTPILQLPIETGKVSVTITDAQGQFNITNLMNGGNPSPEDIGAFRRLLAYYDIDADLVDALVDWMDADNRVRPGGAEDNVYLSYSPPYRTGNVVLIDVEELRLVRGFTPEVITKLRPFLVALPARTKINANTARAPVLGALFAAMPLSEAETLSKSLQDLPLTTPADLSARAGKKYKPLAPYDVRSSYFRVNVFTEIGRYQNRSFAIVFRPVKGQASRRVHRSRTPVYMATTQSKG